VDVSPVGRDEGQRQWNASAEQVPSGDNYRGEAREVRHAVKLRARVELGRARWIGHPDSCGWWKRGKGRSKSPLGMTTRKATAKAGTLRGLVNGGGREADFSAALLTKA
jgi:hypothetical protein